MRDAAKFRAIEASARACRKAAERLAKIKPRDLCDAPRASEVAADVARQLQRDLHELHCLCVEAGAAGPEAHRYGDKRIGMALGRDLLEHRRYPDGIVPGSVQASRSSVAAGLAEFNRWRRDGDGPQPDPREIGELIDAAVALLGGGNG